MTEASRRVRGTRVAMEKQEVLHISVRLRVRVGKSMCVPVCVRLLVYVRLGVRGGHVLARM